MELIIQMNIMKNIKSYILINENDLTQLQKNFGKVLNQ